MASLGALGFIKGASTVALDSIQKRQDHDAELRKAKMLEELRAATAKDLADYQDLLDARKVDDKLSRIEGDEFVMYGSKGNRLGSRALTTDEQEERARVKKKGSLENLGLEVDIADKRSSIASRGRDDAREDRRANAYIRSLDGGGSGTGGKGGGVAGSDIDGFDVAKELRFQQADRVKALEAAGVPASAIVELSEAVAGNGLKAKLSFGEIQAQFKAAAEMMARGTERVEDPDDATKKKNVFSLDRFTRFNPDAAGNLPKR